MSVTPQGVIVDLASETVINEPGKKRRFLYRVEDTRHYTVEIDCDRVKDAEDLMKRLLSLNDTIRMGDVVPGALDARQAWSDWWTATKEDLETEFEFLIDPQKSDSCYYYQDDHKVGSKKRTFKARTESGLRPCECEVIWDDA